MTVILNAVGDVAPDREDPRECFALARATLLDGDLGFCQLECNLTTRGTRLPQARHTHRSTAAAAAAMKEAGFSIVSFAGNHCMDWGPEGLLDSIDNLRNAGLQVVGVGPDIRAARSPVFSEVRGVRTAFLAYSSILPEAYWADDRRAGCAPMRAHTLYEQIEHDQPGTPARIHTWAHRGDLDALVADIRAVRKQAHVVVLSMHWGIHFVPATLADYQREVAHAAIDAGADLILGHHPHILKGVEFYRDRAIFYSLSNFAVDLRMTPAHAASKSFKEIQSLSPGWVPNFDSLYNFPPDSRMTGVARIALDVSGVCGVAFIPAFINDQAQAESLSLGDPRFDQVADYLKWCCAEQGFDTQFKIEDGCIRLAGT
jgi:poly-gamma-glutamate capsule biosynthesis protein CapA/YwtB (metallophosphatase superfamily)